MGLCGERLEAIPQPCDGVARDEHDEHAGRADVAGSGGTIDGCRGHEGRPQAARSLARRCSNTRKGGHAPLPSSNGDPTATATSRSASSPVYAPQSSWPRGAFCVWSSCASSSWPPACARRSSCAWSSSASSCAWRSSFAAGLLRVVFLRAVFLRCRLARGGLPLRGRLARRGLLRRRLASRRLALRGGSLLRGRHRSPPFHRCQDAMRFRRRRSRSLIPPHTPYRSSRRRA